MAAKEISETLNHAIDPAKNLLITVTIGNGQIGGNNLTENGVLKQKGDVKNLLLCAAGACAGKKLVLVTNILDVNPQTNKVSLLIEFSSGLGKTSYLYTGEAEEDGVVRYTVNINLT